MAGGSLYPDEDEQGAITDITVTPFVAVALVLMVIFMVTARLIVARGVEVEKPKSTIGDELKGTILVTVDKDRVIYVQGERQPDRAAARAAISRLAKDDKQARAIIAGDTNVAYGSIFMAIEVTKAAGVQTIALANDPLAEGQIPVIPK
jgi:biopolymer transport protein ExbD